MADIKTYRNMLRINKHRLDDELEEQAQVMDDLSSRVAILNSRVIEAKDVLSRTEARIFRELKDEDDKTTDKAADSAVKRDPERVKAFQAHQAARAEHEEWSGLYEAWKSRRSTLPAT